MSLRTLLRQLRAALGLRRPLDKAAVASGVVRVGAPLLLSLVVALLVMKLAPEQAAVLSALAVFLLAFVGWRLVERAQSAHKGGVTWSERLQRAEVASGEGVAGDPGDTVVRGLRQALGVQHLCAYREEGAGGYRLIAAATPEGIRARAQLSRHEGVVVLLDRSERGELRLAADELRPGQLPFSGGVVDRGTVLIRVISSGGTRQGFWLLVVDTLPPAPALASLDTVFSTLLGHDALLRRAERLETWNQVLKVLYRYAESLQRVDNLEQFSERTSAMLDGLVGAHRFAVVELLPERGAEIRLLAARPTLDVPKPWPLPDPVPRGGFEALTGLDARARAEVLLPPEADDWFRWGRSWYTEGRSPSPLLSLGFVLTTPRDGAFASTDVRDVVALFMRQASEFLHSLVVIDRLRDLAIVDALTGVNNKRYFASRLVEEVLRSQRHETAFSLVLLDLDHFKSVNDTHGHDAGDYVLREIGTLLRSLVRGEDVPARFGGEEFTVILSNTDMEGARRFAERLRVGVAGLSLVFRGLPIPLTASLGYGCFPESGGSTDELLQAVDEALYRAKSAGRNRIEPAGSRAA